jgi:hypothetical protein
VQNIRRTYEQEVATSLQFDDETGAKQEAGRNHFLMVSSPESECCFKSSLLLKDGKRLGIEITVLKIIGA